MNKSVKYIAIGGIIAAMYVVLTYVCSLMGLSSGVVQVRFSEALCILPCFMPAAIPGLFVGCLLSNLLTGCALWDVVFGSLATLIGACGTYLLRKNRFLAAVPPIMANTIIVPFVLRLVYEVPDAMWLLFLTVFIGEFISIGILGELLYSVIKKYGRRLWE